ncbi:hypothetical protein [Mangrovimonas sp. TPBH4]|uniref:hypothetical protein n=1 Tax=Mangrovimonas sp. TPBH4 TaxID=1645914 RepID=UPI0006B402EA|nr:hypothetical protein [Mangrovimonas sp. TPBH4]
MKILIIILFFFYTFFSFSQSLEEREKITAEFEKLSDTKIELYNINSFPQKLDSIQLKSDFLKSKNIDYKILGFRISGVNENGEMVLFFKSSKGNIIPTDFKDKISSCSECKSVKVDRITINWFTGTYTLKTSQTWSIK